jgi:hypothetical protein
VARRAGLDESGAQDVVQETVIAVARKMPGFRYDPQRGSFKQWLLRITHRRIAGMTAFARIDFDRQMVGRILLHKLKQALRPELWML